MGSADYVKFIYSPPSCLHNKGHWYASNVYITYAMHTLHSYASGSGSGLDTISVTDACIRLFDGSWGPRCACPPTRSPHKKILYLLLFLIVFVYIA